MLYLKLAPYILIAVLLAGLAGLHLYDVQVHKADVANIKTLKTQVDAVVEVNHQNLDAIAQMKEHAARSLAATEAARVDAEKRAAVKEKVTREIFDAPKADDGPLPSILSRTLERLFGPNREDSNAGPGGKAGGPGGAVQLPKHPGVERGNGQGRKSPGQ